MGIPKIKLLNMENSQNMIIASFDNKLLEKFFQEPISDTLVAHGKESRKQSLITFANNNKGHFFKGQYMPLKGNSNHTKNRVSALNKLWKLSGNAEARKEITLLNNFIIYVKNSDAPDKELLINMHKERIDELKKYMRSTPSDTFDNPMLKNQPKQGYKRQKTKREAMIEEG